MIIEADKLVVVVGTNFADHQRLEDGADLAKDRQGRFVKDPGSEVIVKVIAQALHKSAAGA